MNLFYCQNSFVLQNKRYSIIHKSYVVHVIHRYSENSNYEKSKKNFMQRYPTMKKPGNMSFEVKKRKSMDSYVNKVCFYL